VIVTLPPAPAGPDAAEEPDEPDEHAAAALTVSSPALAAASARQLSLRIAGMTTLLGNGTVNL
jgi:hypothetical protein